LAMAALMGNKGQIYAYDADGRRLTPAIARLTRSGARNIQIRAPRGKQDVLSDLTGHCDLVFIDAPCTGCGTWRRNPDAKWRTRPGALAQRIVEQRAILEQAAGYAKPGGRIVYVTCSLLREENEDRVRDFLGDHLDFSAEQAAATAAHANLPELARFASPHSLGLRFSPRTAETDGFCGRPAPPLNRRRLNYSATVDPPLAIFCFFHRVNGCPEISIGIDDCHHLDHTEVRFFEFVKACTLRTVHWGVTRPNHCHKRIGISKHLLDGSRGI
jgi:16S rRNA methyltransferase RsmB/F